MRSMVEGCYLLRLNQKPSRKPPRYPSTVLRTVPLPNPGLGRIAGPARSIATASMAHGSASWPRRR